MSEKLYRSADDQMLTGVCAGLGNYFDLDPTIVRLVFVITAFASSFVPAIAVYFILALVMPLDPTTQPPAASAPTEFVDDVVDEVESQQESQATQA